MTPRHDRKLVYAREDLLDFHGAHPPQFELAIVYTKAKRYPEAELLLIENYGTIKTPDGTVLPSDQRRLSAVLKNLVQLNEARGKADEVARWRKELDAANVMKQGQ